MRFTNVPPSLHCRVAAGGASKTTMSPRRGSWKRYASRFAITRSEKLPSHPAAGRAHWSVGSIEADGMRYGFATSTLTVSTIATAIPRVTIQSIATRAGLGKRCVRRSSGVRMLRLRVAGAGSGGKLDRGAVAAAVDLRLELADVRGEVALLLAEALLEVGDLLLTQLELVLADLEVGLEARLARLDLRLALVDLT